MEAVFDEMQDHGIFAGHDRNRIREVAPALGFVEFRIPVPVGGSSLVASCPPLNNRSELHQCLSLG